MKKIFAISGSIKQRSSNRRILELLGDISANQAAFEIYDGLTDLPYFVPGLDEISLPTEVKYFLTKIKTADAVVISTPEYVFGLPGILKNALEWTVPETVLSGKPVAFVVAAASGKKAFESLDLILETLVQSNIPANRKLLIPGIAKYFDEFGCLTDNDIQLQLSGLIESLY